MQKKYINLKDKVSRFFRINREKSRKVGIGYWVQHKQHADLSNMLAILAT
jgi:hypothetical protein